MNGNEPSAGFPAAPLNRDTRHWRWQEKCPDSQNRPARPGVAGLKVVGFRPLLPQHRIGDEQSGRSHVDHRLGVLCDP